MRIRGVVAAVLAAATLALGAQLAFPDRETLAPSESREILPGEYAELPDGVVRYAYDAPRPGQSLLVLVHGGALNSLAVFDPLLDALGRGAYGTLRFDAYGQGGSARPERRHDAALYVAQIDALLAHVDGDVPVHLVGYSQGGLIATEYAAHRPQRVASLTLLAPAGLATSLRWPLRLGAWPVIGEVVYRIRGPEILIDGYGRMAHAQRYAEHVRRVEAPWLAIEGTGRSLLSQLRSLPIEGPAGAYRYVGASDVPVLAILGDDDATIPREAAAAVLRAAVPDARVVVLERASHALVYEDAARVAPLVRGFVDSH